MSHSFAGLGLSAELTRAVSEQGYAHPTPVQAQAIPVILSGRDVLAGAQTGTGKTAGFALPLLQRLAAHGSTSASPARHPIRALILTPTRELAAQVGESVRTYGRYLPLRFAVIYGGVNINPQVQALQRGVDVLVATPGRLLDHVQQKSVHLGQVQILVLDEADRMLDMGFIEDISFILSRAPSYRQTSLFSATIDKTVMNVCNRYMKNPVKILVSKDEIGLTQMKQFYTVVNQSAKFDALCTILEEEHVDRAIVFCRTRHETSKIAEKLSRRGYNTQALHAGFTQPQRDTIVNSFRRGKLRLLIATDVAARGLDIQGITHIINYDVPLDALVYFHRIGRTARMGGEGTAITLVGYGELPEFENIKAMTKTTIEEMS